MDRIKFIIFNARGLSTAARIAEIEKFLLDYCPDILFVQESFLNPITNIYSKLYKIYRLDRATHGGGLLIFIKRSIRSEEIYYDFTLKCAEALSIKIFLQFGNQYKEFVCTNLYIPKYNRHLKADLKHLMGYENSIIAGDTNAIHNSWSDGTENMTGKLLFNMLPFKNHLLFAPDGHTHTHPNGSISTIDVLITNCSEYNDDIEVCNGLASDHLPVSFSFNGDLRTSEPKKVYDYDRADWLSFFISFRNYLVPDMIGTDDVDTEIDRFIVKLKRSFDDCVPKRTIQYKADSYLSSATTNLIARKNAVVRRMHRTTITHGEKESLRLLRNRLSAQIRDSVFSDRCVRWERLIVRMSQSKKEFWQLSKIARKKSNRKIVMMNDNNMSVSNAQAIANLFADKFEMAHTSFPIAHNAFDQKIEREYANWLAVDIPAPAEIFTADDLLTIIAALRNGKAPGLDGVTNIMLKRLPPTAQAALIKIFNRSYQLGYWPTQFKTSIVIPVHKKGKEPTSVDSYRPVSLLSSISKLFERLVKLKLDEETARVNPLPPTQFGFRSHRSSTQQATNLAASLKINKSHRKSTGILFMDVSKAFDSVWHAGLIRRLADYGYVNHLIKLIAVYCHDRHFLVKVKGARSALKPIPAGVPQGGCLSPVLYNIYTSNINFGQAEGLTYADDTAIIHRGVVGNAIVKRLASSAAKFNSQLNKWHIKVNAAKTEFLFVPPDRKRRRAPTIPLAIGGVLIEQSSIARYLGVLFDNKLTFNGHCLSIKGKAVATIISLYSIFRNNLLPYSHRRSLVKSVLHPIMFHSAPAWSDVTGGRIKSLRQKFGNCARQILGVHRTYSTNDLLDLLNYQPIETQLLSSKQKLYDRLLESLDPDLINLANKILLAWPNFIR